VIDERLRSNVRFAVDHGCTRDELEALATLLGVYAGFPRASAGIEVIRAELDKLEQQ
jgi:alkylhydroperoxidase/carboxymuconolactone decarboxylase family protein YurZ